MTLFKINFVFINQFVKKRFHTLYRTDLKSILFLKINFEFFKKSILFLNPTPPWVTFGDLGKSKVGVWGLGGSSESEPAPLNPSYWGRFTFSNTLCRVPSAISDRLIKTICTLNYYIFTSLICTVLCGMVYHVILDVIQHVMTDCARVPSENFAGSQVKLSDFVEMLNVIGKMRVRVVQAAAQRSHETITHGGTCNKSCVVRNRKRTLLLFDAKHLRSEAHTATVSLGPEPYWLGQNTF